MEFSRLSWELEEFSTVFYIALVFQWSVNHQLFHITYSILHPRYYLDSLCIWLQFDGKHIVSGSLDTSIRVWDVDTGSCLHTLTGHQSLTSGMEIQDGLLVSGNADSTVKVWDINTGTCLQTLTGQFLHFLMTISLSIYLDCLFVYILARSFTNGFKACCFIKMKMIFCMQEFTTSFYSQCSLVYVQKPLTLLYKLVTALKRLC